MVESKSRKLIGLFILLLAPSAGMAQRLELAVHGGYFLPAAEQFNRAVARPMSSGYSVSYYDGHHDPGVAIGLSVTGWPLSRFGLDLAGGVRFCDRSGSAPFFPGPSLPVPAGDRAVLSSLALRLVGRTHVGGTAVRLGAGPVLVHIGGSAYDGGTAEISIAKRTLPGATILADITHVVGPLRLQVGVEDVLYRVAMASVPGGTDTTGTPLQHDLALSVGVVLRVR
jgi:hypothetical protein